MMKQKILNGIECLSEALKGSKKTLLVIDSSFPFLNIKDEVENIHIPFVKFSDFTPNPLYDDVCKGVDLLNAEHTFLIIQMNQLLLLCKPLMLQAKLFVSRKQLQPMPLVTK
jgi:hypothetical protein